MVTTLLLTSSTWTVTAGLMALPATVLVGCWTKPRWSAWPGVISKLVEVAPVRLPELA